MIPMVLVFFIFIIFHQIHASPMADFISKEARILEKKYHLSRFGTGFFGPYKGYDFSYNFLGEKTIPEARKLTVSFANDLKNKTKILRFDKGFRGEKNGMQALWLSITFIDKNGKYVFREGFISMVTLFYDQLIYEVYDPKSHTFKTIYKESFEEAAEIVSKSFLQNCNN